ncbi:MAG TPA: macro domain-containing protein, partial [Streptosporangiaceae bacterium]|nr:macro domain-containing protein [Streptosporangiaceae bacterium]
LARALETAIPAADAQSGVAAHPLRAALDEQTATARRLAAEGAPDTRPFDFSVINPEWAWDDFSLTETGPRELRMAAYGIGTRPEALIAADLASLARHQQAMATWWLTDLRVRLHHLITQRPDIARDLDLGNQVVLRVDRLLDRLYLDALRRVPGLQALRDLTATPPASQVKSLQEARSPAPRKGQSLPFRNQLEDGGATFSARIHDAYLADIEHLHNLLVTGRGEAEHDQADDQGRLVNLFEKDHIERIAVLAMNWAKEAFGPLIPDRPALKFGEPGQDGDIFDAFSYRRWEDNNSTQQQLFDRARLSLIEQVNRNANVTRVAKEHNADPHYDESGFPDNEEARIIGEIADELASNSAIRDRVLEIERGWPAFSEGGKVYIQLFRLARARDNQDVLWKIMLTFLHENMHALASREFDVWAAGLPGEYERNVMVEGLATLWTEVHHDHVGRDLSDERNYESARQVIEGPYADAGERPPDDLPDVVFEQRYDEIDDVMQIVRQAGILNVFAGTFAADREKMTGPGPGAHGSLLAPAGPATRHYELPDLTGLTPPGSEGSSAATSPGTMSPLTLASTYLPSPPGSHARQGRRLPPGWRPRRTAPPPPGPLATRLPAPAAPAAAATAPRRQPPHVSVITGDLHSLPARVGAIVRPASTALLGQDEVRGQILGPGGAALATAEIEQRYPDGARPGDAAGTAAPGGVNADYVIHAVGPDFRDAGRAQGEAQLQAGYRSALAVADELGIASVAFPLLPAGERRGALQPQELHALAVQALSTTQTGVRHVYLVRPAPAARAGAPPAAGAEDLDTLETQRLHRIQQVTDQGRQAHQVYARVRAARGIHDVAVSPGAGGDTFYRSVMHPDAFGSRMRQVLGAEPTVRLMRDHLATALYAEFYRMDRGERTIYRTARLFPDALNRPGSQRVRQQVLHSITTMGEWDTEAAESVVQFAALVWELPATLLGRWNVLDIGPRDLAPERYIQGTGEHFAVAATARPVEVADVLYQSGELAGLPAEEDDPPPNVSLQRIETYVSGFEILRRRLTELTEASAAVMTSPQADYGREIIEAFYAEMSDMWPLDEAAQAQHRLGTLHAALRNVITNLESGSPVLSRPPQPVAARLGYLVASPRLIRRGGAGIPDPAGWRPFPPADSERSEPEALDTAAVDRALLELLERQSAQTPPAQTPPAESLAAVAPADKAAVRRADHYLSGDPAFDLPPTQLPILIKWLLTGPYRDPEAALRMLNAVDATELAALVRGGLLRDGPAAAAPRPPSGPRMPGPGGELRDRLEPAFPERLRGDLGAFFDRRFDGNGQVRPDVQPAKPFSFEMIRPSLAHIPAAQLTGPQRDQISAALDTDPGRDVIGDLLHELPPVQLARAWWLLADAGAGHLWADRALRSLTGNPAHDLTPGQTQKLFGLLVRPDATSRDGHAVLALLHHSGNEVLREIFADRQLLPALDAGISGGRRRTWLDQFIARRFSGGWAALAEGRVEPQGMQDGTFTLAVIAPSLADISTTSLAGELSMDQLTRIAAAINGVPPTTATPTTKAATRRPPDEIQTAIESLPWTEWPRATWSLSRLRVAMHAHYAPYVLYAEKRADPGRPWLLEDAAGSLDSVLSWFHYFMARNRDAPALREMTVTPDPWEVPGL